MAEAADFRVAVVGDGLDAAMAAALLSRRLPSQQFAVVLVATDAPDPEPFGAVDSSLPSVRGFHARLGLDEGRLVRSGMASFGLGIDYRGWNGSVPGPDFLPFGDVGATLDGVAFHQIVHRLRAHGHALDLHEHSLAALLARNGRFAHPSDDPRSPLSTYTYGLHLHRRSYADQLRRMAIEAGAIRSPAPFAGVDLAADGAIAAIRTADGEPFAADLWVDASGTGTRLISSLPGSRFQSWRQWLACDRSLTFAADSTAEPPPFASVTAHPSGWRRVVQAGGHAGEVLAYTSDFGLSDEAAFAAHATGEFRFEQGRRCAPWIGNCVAVGGAAALLEPTASMPLHLLMSSLERLVTMIPAGQPGAVDAREYNRLTAQELDRARDFTILRHKLNGRGDGPLWQRSRGMQVPDELAHKIGEFERRGRVPLLDGDLFDQSEWAVTFDSLGVRPRRRDPLADALPLERLERQLERMRSIMLASVAKVPVHAAYLAQVARRTAA